MRFNWKLSHKGIILVSVPLVFELIFVLALAGLLKHAEHKAWTSKKGKEIVVRVGNWSKHLIEAHVMLVNYGFMHDPAALLAYERRLAQIPEVEKKLRVLAEDFPQVVPNLDRMQEYNRRMVIIMEESRHAIEGGGTMRMIPIARRIFVQMKTSYQPFMHEVEDITQQVHKFSASDAEEKRTMDIVWAVLVAGIAFNIVLTIVLAIFFSKGITSRLSVLVDNTIKMKERKPLSAPIAGTDEIAELDRVFHEMADALGRAERQKQDFVSMISHDLRSPLTALQTTLAMANKGSYGQLNDKGKKRIEAAEASVERLIKLINELLDIEKMEAGMLKLSIAPSDLDKVIERSIETVRALAEQSNIKIAFEISHLSVMADADRLSQVVVNLLSNAVKFSPPGARIVIEAKKQAEFAEVSVTDEGPGIPGDALTKVFDRFQQADPDDSRARSGTGLGLAISKAIVEGHGGAMGVNSEVGKGSRFWFRIRLGDGDA